MIETLLPTILNDYGLVSVFALFTMFILWRIMNWHLTQQSEFAHNVKEERIAYLTSLQTLNDSFKQLTHQISILSDENKTAHRAQRNEHEALMHKN